jgi:YVTN family beta-propeller protein
MRRLLSLIACVLLLASCQARPFLTGARPPLETEGAAFAYLSPLPEEAQRLSFRIAELHADRADGGRVPLPLSLAQIDSSAVDRERLLAHGPLPPGQYTGLSLRVEKADLKGEEGAAALRLPEEAAVIPVPFAVERRRAVVLKLQFRYEDSVKEEFQFTPVFSASIPGPGEVAAARIGLASSRGAGAVTMFDRITGQVVSVIPTGESPVGMAIDPARNRAYVAASGEDAVDVIDLLEARVLERLRLAGGDAPAELALTPDGGTLLAANPGSNTVSLIDPLAMLETERIPVGSEPRFLLLDRTGRRAYVFNTQSNTISVLDVPRAAVTATIPTESGPTWGQLNRDGSRLYVLQRGSPYLGVVDTASLSLARGPYVGTGAASLKVDPRTDWIYIPRRGSAVVDVYDPFSLLPMDAVPAGGEAAHLAIDGEENNLWIVLPEADRVLAVGLTGKRRAAAVDVGGEPRRVTLMGER